MLSSTCQSAVQRTRHKFSDEDRSVLEKQFGLNPRPSAEARDNIARLLNMGDKQVQIWFNNARQRHLPPTDEKIKCVKSSMGAIMGLL
jgi:hypothetical protein